MDSSRLARALLFVALCLFEPVGRAAVCAGPDEPPLPTLEAAALRVAALEPGRVRSMISRARVSALLPQVIGRVGRGSYDSVRDADTLDPTSLSSDTLRWEVTVHLSLDRLIFDVHELRVAEAAGRLAEHRYALLERVAVLWSERRALQRGQEVEADPTQHEVDTIDRCAQLTALLDSLTGGALTTATQTKSLPRAPPRR